MAQSSAHPLFLIGIEINLSPPFFATAKVSVITLSTTECAEKSVAGFGY